MLTKRGREAAIVLASTVLATVGGTLIEWEVRPIFPAFVLFAASLSSLCVHVGMVVSASGKEFTTPKPKRDPHKPEVF